MISTAKVRRVRDKKQKQRIREQETIIYGTIVNFINDTKKGSKSAIHNYSANSFCYVRIPSQMFWIHITRTRVVLK